MNPRTSFYYEKKRIKFRNFDEFITSEMKNEFEQNIINQVKEIEEHDFIKFEKLLKKTKNGIWTLEADGNYFYLINVDEIPTNKLFYDYDDEEDDEIEKEILRLRYGNN